MSPLAHTVLAPPGTRPARWMAFLHGILGTRANWRSFARKWMARREGWGAVLVDLRMHGDSQGFAPPHTVEACARDLAQLCEVLGHGFAGVLGHSFGGKVALAFAARSEVSELWSIDSMPGPRAAVAVPGSALAIIDLLETLPREYEQRDGFVERVEAAGIGRGVAQWLAMNLVAEGGKVHLRMDLAAMRALLLDFLARDDWPSIEQPRPGSRLHVVVAGRSSVWSAADLERARRQASVGHLDVHVMPAVGHLVHVEDPDGLLEIVAPDRAVG